MGKPVVIGVGEFLWDVLPDGKKADSPRQRLTDIFHHFKLLGTSQPEQAVRVFRIGNPRFVDLQFDERKKFRSILNLINNHRRRIVGEKQP